MLNPSMEALISALKEAFGETRVETYGCADDYQDGAHIRVRGVPLNLSAHTSEGSLPFGVYDVQIEPDAELFDGLSSDEAPPYDVYTAMVSLEELMAKLERTSQGVWP